MDGDYWKVFTHLRMIMKQTSIHSLCRSWNIITRRDVRSQGDMFTEVNSTKNLMGHIFFGDFCTGTIWGLRNRNGEWEFANFLKTDHMISSFGFDQGGNIYIVDFKSGDIYKIVSE